jgi:hypothetical protein
MIKKPIIYYLILTSFLSCNQIGKDSAWIKEELRTTEKSIHNVNLAFEKIILEFSKGIDRGNDLEPIVRYVKGIDEILDLYIDRISENENVIFCVVGIKVDKGRTNKRVYQKIKDLGFIVFDSIPLEGNTHSKSTLSEHVDKLELCMLDTKEVDYLRCEVIRFEYSKKFDAKNDVNLALKIAIAKK